MTIGKKPTAPATVLEYINEPHRKLQALAAPAKQVPFMMRMEEGLLAQVDAQAKREGSSRANFLRRLAISYFEAKSQQ
jgi:hypothetical protein